MKPLAAILLLVKIFLAEAMFAAVLSPSLLEELDRKIENQAACDAKKEDGIGNWKKRLSEGNAADEERCFICLSLSKEYETYQCDSAIRYACMALEAAQRTGDPKRVAESRIQWARTLTKAGFLGDAGNILRGMDSRELSESQRVNFYKTCIDFYVFAIEYQDGYAVEGLVSEKRRMQDSLLAIADLASYEYLFAQVMRQLDAGDFRSARKALQDYLPRVEPDSKEYASITSLLSHACCQEGDTIQREKYLALSAAADVQAAIKETISLRVLAELLFEKGDLLRANRYVKKSLDDANFYNARLRNIQISKVLPIIDRAYGLEQQRQQIRMRKLLMVITTLLLILLITVFFIISQMRKLATAKRCIEQSNIRLNELNAHLKEANRKQRKANAYLAESNCIKELFIGNFLEIGTLYIEKLKAFKLLVKRKIKAGQSADILRLVSSAEETGMELKELYEKFDRAFLKVYPTFVQEFNRLLREQERYPVHEDQSLNQELRIFALVRLGIRDINKIAVFLNYSHRTVYNYRCKVKSKALNPDADFEQQVRKLCTEHE